MKFKIVLIGAFALLTACYPVKFTETPKVSGRVVDSESKDPISGANIYFKEHPEKKVQSDLQGRFIYDPIMEWHWILFWPFDLRLPQGDLLIEMSGYESLEKRIYGHGALEVQDNFVLKRK